MGHITQDEYLKISDLLHSDNVKEIMQFMSIQYAGSRQEYCDHLLGLIPQIAQANVNYTRPKGRELLVFASTEPLVLTR